MDEIVDLLKIKIEKAKSKLSDDTLNAIAVVDWRNVIFQMRQRRGFSFEQLESLELETELVLCGLLDPKNYPKELETRMQISKAAANELVIEMNNLVFTKIKEELIKITERKKIFDKKAPTIEVPFKRDYANIIPDETIEEKLKNIKVLNEHGIEIIDEAIKNTQIPEVKTEVQKKEAPILVPTPTPKVEAEKPTTETLPVVEKLELTTEPEKIEKKPTMSEIHPILAQKLSGVSQSPIVKTEHTLENITKASQVNTIKAPSHYPPKADPYRLSPDE